LAHLKKVYVDSDLNFTGPSLRENEAELRAASSPFNGEPPVEVLDVSEGWDSIAKFDLAVQRLKDLGLYGKDLLFCAADWQRIEKLGFETERVGSLLEGPYIQCSTEADIRDRHAERNMAAEMCEFDNPALIVFQESKLERLGCDEYVPKPDVPLREAAVIILLITSNDF
jgi:hypothetical protein